MRAIILAAGEGNRLRPYTADRPKGLVELAGKPLLVHQLESLQRAGIRDVTIVAGYRADQIQRLGRPTVVNEAYDSTNMVASLMCAADRLDGTDDVLITYGDIVFETRVVEAIRDCDAPISTTVDRNWLALWKTRNEDPLADAETLRLDAAGDIVELGRKPSSLDEIEAQYMGLIKFRAAAAADAVAVHRGLDPAGSYDGKDLANMYMTSFLQHLIDHDRKVRSVPVDGGWLEVDTAEDLETFNRMQAEGRLSEFCRLGA